MEMLCNDIGSTPMDAQGFHVRFEDIHPFEDGNGRVGRALMPAFQVVLNEPIYFMSRYFYHTRQKYYHMIRTIIENNTIM